MNPAVMYSLCAYPHPSELRHLVFQPFISYRRSIRDQLGMAILHFEQESPHSPPPIKPPPAFRCSSCILWMYCLLTVFHAAMYFSIQLVKQLSSPFERFPPGFGTQRSKQCSLIFYKSYLANSHLTDTILQRQRTSINCLALVVAASCLY